MSETAAATLAAAPAGAVYQYSVTLNDTGTTSVGTFWFAWNDVPDVNLMTTPPTAIASPAGWSATLTYNLTASGYGYGILWTATAGSELAAGGTLGGFSFQSAESPAAMAGPSAVYPALATTTSFIYAGGPFSDPGFRFDVSVACFAAGTRLRTPHGDVAVEALSEGDMVMTLRGPRPVRWIGHRRVDCRRTSRPWDVCPVRVRAGAFGPGRPWRDVRLSPDHAVLVGGTLVPVRYLINDVTVVQEPARRTTYWHVEFDRHEVVLAEGLPAESYLDTGNRHDFRNGEGPGPDAAAALSIWRERGAAPLATEGPAVTKARVVLLRRAFALGHDITEEPDLWIAAGRSRLRPRRQQDGSLLVVLPARLRRLRLCSRAAAPAHVRPSSDDCRRLGVAVTHLALDGVPLALDDERLRSGWHPPEEGFRWTDGEAVVACPGARRLTLRLLPLMRYWIRPEPGPSPSAAAVAPLRSPRHG